MKTSETRPRPSRNVEREILAERLENRCLLASTGTLLSYDFSTNSWQASPGALSAGVTASLAYGGYGTVDTEGATAGSNALRLTVNSAPAAPWSADLASGKLAVTNTETNLGKLTLAFSLSVSQLHQVRVVVTSYDAAGNRGGALETDINPAATFSYQRYALDLSTMTASGNGTFNPTSPKVSFDLEMNTDNGWTTASSAQLRLDNVHYARPSYYVSATGGNNGGKTEATAFKTPQQAIDLAQPGDIILLMNGTYNQVTKNTGAIQFDTGGTPAAWITVKNYPGQTPVIYNEAWNAIKIGRGASDSLSTDDALAYLEIRGLDVKGDSAKVGSFSGPDGPYDASQAGKYGEYGQYAGVSDPRSNGNGISVDGRYETHKPHDIRIADNTVENMAGAGIGAGDTDRVQIEDNVVRDNCYWDIYATSGISILSAYNFDGNTNTSTVTRLVRNNVTSGNIHKEIWASHGEYSDGNGIIIDVNHNTTSQPNGVTRSRTLVTNNISFNNGGSGIHAFDADHVDIVNNVAYLNSASPYLQYGEIFSNYSNDVRIYNNILVAPVAASGKPAEPVNGGTRPTADNGIVYYGNVYYGGNTAPFAADAYNVNNVIGDPKFLSASIDPAVANFHLISTSPAINRGSTALAPNVDFVGKPHYANPDAGVYEYLPAPPTAVTLAVASDTGTAGDKKTNLNNSAAASRLSFNVTGTLSGATVNLYAGTTLIGRASATGTSTVITTNGTAAIADGSVAVTAQQTFMSAPSAGSSALAIVIDTAAPTIAAAVSRKTHGSAGIYDLALDLASAAGTVEPRKNGPTTLVFTFPEPVAATDGVLSANEFTLTGGTFASAAVTGNTLTLALSGLVDLRRLTVALNGIGDIAGNALTGDRDVVVRPLLGDVNGSGRVDIFDQQLVKNALLKPLTSLSFLNDLDYTGAVNIFDQQIVKDNLLHVLT